MALVVSFSVGLARWSLGNSFRKRANLAATSTPRYLLPACLATSAGVMILIVSPDGFLRKSPVASRQNQVSGDLVTGDCRLSTAFQSSPLLRSRPFAALPRTRAVPS